MRPHARATVVLGLVALVSLVASSASALTLFEDEETGRSLSLSGYMQPYVRIVPDICVPSQADPTQCSVAETPDGFGLQRARLSISGAANDIASFKLELRSVPNMQVLEAVVGARIAPGFTLRFGRYRVPFSRQELISESRLQLDRASILSHTPGRQLGASLRFDMPGNWSALPESFIVAEAGVWNGESAKEQSPINNIDSQFLFAGRLEINPLGQFPDGEGDLRDGEDRREPLVGAGVNYARNRNDNDGFDEDTFGADLLAKWNGLSFYAEYGRRNRDYDGINAGVDQYSIGFNTQIGYVLPFMYSGMRWELVVRVEQFDPEVAARDADEDLLLAQSPGGGPGASEEQQAQRTYVGGLNWYIRGHDFKVQANYSYRQAMEDWSLSAADPDVPQDVDDNSFLLVATYRF